MGVFSDSVVAASRRSRGLAQKLLADIRPELFARKPIIGAVTIDTNHPAFVYGHLALYPARTLTLLGKDASSVAPPEGFDALFKAGAPCLDDPAGTIYPAMEAITAAYFRAHDNAYPVISAIPDADFAQENTDPRSREYAPTHGQVAVLLLNNHMAMHLGQISAWRRCMGLSPV